MEHIEAIYILLKLLYRYYIFQRIESKIHFNELRNEYIFRTLKTIESMHLLALKLLKY